MSKKVTQICCTCVHCERIKKDDTNIWCECDLDGKYLDYLTVMNSKCDKWEVDPWQLKDGDNEWKK